MSPSIPILVICLSFDLSAPVPANAGTFFLESAKGHAADSLDAGAILRGATMWVREQWLRRRLLVQDILTHTSTDLSDSTLFFRLQQKSLLRLSPSQLRNLPPRVDMIEERLRREQLDLPPMSNIGNLLAAGTKFLKEKLGGGGASPQALAVIPSELEIDVMKVLWKKDAATTSEIYSHLDSIRLTAVDLQQVLDTMTERGLLERQLISPRHEFTIFSGLTIEMSGRNRKNREYIYHPQ
ncbi:MAG: BlaI/MecI/CopY family transcriptional regulator, partial [candidate division KSB1 bacterium]|nr:BlaI/MecI/CopY family transcriptional regulator [candidate division KSB1 bacterium]